MGNVLSLLQTLGAQMQMMQMVNGPGGSGGGMPQHSRPQSPRAGPLTAPAGKPLSSGKPQNGAPDDRQGGVPRRCKLPGVSTGVSPALPPSEVPPDVPVELQHAELLGKMESHEAKVAVRLEALERQAPWLE